MHITTTRIDIARTKAGWTETVFAPAYVMPRKDKKKWQVADSPIGVSPLTWALTSADEYIRIPLFKYTLTTKGDLALAGMFQLGLICTEQLDTAVAYLHIVTGVPVELMADSAGNVSSMEYWMGFAVAFED
jgi:hypothetical protein